MATDTRSCGRPAAALLLSFVAACGGDDAPVRERELALTECEIGGTSAKCGFLEVPENWNRPSGRTIRLNVVVLPATGAGRHPPLIDLAGGPGLAATEGAAYYATDGLQWRKGRDVVMFDQRGTGKSAPAHCPSVGNAGTLAPMYPEDRVRECVEKLSRTHDLEQYSTPVAVRDLEAVRAALGTEQVDFFAMSYGTRLAQAYIRAYPQRVRAAVFVGAVPMDLKSPLSHARNAEAALQSIFADCERDAACAGAFPELRENWESLKRSLREGQIGMDLQNGRKTIGPGPFMEAFRTILTAEAGQRKAPALIAALSLFDTEEFVGMVASEGPPTVAEGVYLSVECTEGTNRITEAEIEDATAGTFLGRYRIDQQRGACSVWPRTDVPGSFFEPVVSNVPVLLVVGGRDHVTPAAYSRAIAEGFRHSSVVVVDEMGHVPDAISGLECLDRVMLDLYDAPSSPPDSACVAGMRAPPFRLKATAD